MLTPQERFENLERREGITGNELADLLGVGSGNYHSKVKKVKKLSRTWRIALLYIERYGLDLLRSVRGRL